MNIVYRIVKYRVGRFIRFRLCRHYQTEPGMENELEPGGIGKCCGSCDHFRSWHKDDDESLPEFYCALDKKEI